MALLVALADLGGVWDLAAVTGALTGFADGAVAAGLQALVAAEIRRGRMPGARPEDAADAAGMVVLAMGKMGAFELNYSSDIDLICLFDESRFDDRRLGHGAGGVHPGDPRPDRAARRTRPATAMCFAPICGCARMPP